MAGYIISLWFRDYIIISILQFLQNITTDNRFKIFAYFDKVGSID